LKIKTDIKTEKVYLNALFLDTISRFSAIIQSKKINVSTQFFRQNTDGYYLFSIVINNLISNALKYSNQTET
jgi:signal transduction histidine kinase